MRKPSKFSAPTVYFYVFAKSEFDLHYKCFIYVSNAYTFIVIVGSEGENLSSAGEVKGNAKQILKVVEVKFYSKGPG